jgi:cobalt/nickel transport system permease protein
MITGLVVRFLLLTRPDLVYGPEAAEPAGVTRGWQAAAAGLAVALAVAAFLAPFASASPDGLEYVGAKLGFMNADSAPVVTAPFADYGLPGLEQTGVATAVVGLLGTLAVFGAGLGLARAFGRRAAGAERPAEVSPHAV